MCNVAFQEQLLL